MEIGYLVHSALSPKSQSVTAAVFRCPPWTTTQGVFRSVQILPNHCPRSRTASVSLISLRRRTECPYLLSTRSARSRSRARKTSCWAPRLFPPWRSLAFDSLSLSLSHLGLLTLPLPPVSCHVRNHFLLNTISVGVMILKYCIHFYHSIVTFLVLFNCELSRCNFCHECPPILLLDDCEE